MLKDIPYGVLKQNERAYEIMLLRDQHNNTFADIAKEYEISLERTKQIYTKIKINQIRLYINHISIVFAHENVSQIRAVFENAYECYQDYFYACAYLEKKYKNILIDYREGEPGIPLNFIKSMPPLKPKLSKKIVACIIEMREVKKMSYIAIGKELHMTQAKAKHTYDNFYHKQVLVLIRQLQKKATSREEEKAIWEYHFRSYKTPKKRYDEITKAVVCVNCSSKPMLSK